MSFNIFEKAKENILVVAHRGASGGNIPCNTLTSYEIALKQGADMLEVDVSKSADDVLYIFHPHMEEDHFNIKKEFETMNFEDIRKERYVNFDNSVTQFGVPSFDEFLEQFKGRCFINIDKFWDNPQAIYKKIKEYNMLDQVVVKSSINKKLLDTVEDLCRGISFLPIVCDTHPLHEELLKRNINYIGAEVIFTDENAQVCSDEFIEMMHRDGKLVWANSIIYDYKEQLAAGHSDDTAFTISEDYGWGWLADKGFDLIQTDWAMMLIDYLKKSGKYYKK